MKKVSTRIKPDLSCRSGGWFLSYCSGAIRGKLINHVGFHYHDETVIPVFRVLLTCTNQPKGIKAQDLLELFSRN